ncbi:MAG: hypothetical protein ABIO04_01100 [Ferruginibacter sp.]
METYILEQDVKLFCVPASCFPSGIKKAFEELKNVHPSIEDRDLFGISYGSGKGIIYKAAAQEAYEGEGEKYGYESLILKKGEYLTQTITEWYKDENRIGKVFSKLLSTPMLDPNGFCIEWYKSTNEVLCMVRLTTIFA